MSSVKIVYFPARGRAELARLVLAAAGQDWEEEVVTGETMPALKESGRLPFGQVPLLEDGNVTVSQSMAMARYLARKHDLYGDLVQGAVADQIIDGNNDLLAKFIPHVFGPNASKEGVGNFVRDILPGFLQAFSKLLQSNKDGKEWAAGNSFSFADIALFAITESMLFDQEWVKKEDYPLLAAHYERVKAVNNIASYLASSKRHPARKIEAA
mmetsp:Transcript_36171/g.101921  ORF Transcript_36171/g.101921 Transcript_36171/m.101921 type:complete len:212 (+) Transcript_36171:91-726(+)